MLPIHPATGFIALIGLSLRAKDVIKGLRQERRDLWLYAILALVGIISIIGAYDVQRGIVNFLVPFLFIWLYALGRWAIKDPTRFLVSMLHGTAFFGLVILVARIFGLELFLGGFTILGDFTPPAPRGNVLGVPSNGLAVVLEAGVVGGLGLLFTVRTTKERLVALLIALLSMGGIMVTMSRGAMVAMIAGTVALGLLLSPRVLIPFGAAAVAMLALFERFRNRFASIIDLGEHEGRLGIWQSTLNLIRDHLWFGVGPGNFGLVYPSYAVNEDVAGFGSAHNNYLFFTAQWGIVGGLLFYGWHAWVLIRSLLRGMGSHQKIMWAILIAFATHTLVDDLMTVYAGLLLGCLENDAYLSKKSA